ncbi:MAG: NAD(P)-binding domain-containing protein [Pelagibacteraceae bacterium]|nr:NAD(P)-binding domain-containing protein [Pelagibacteraceae bacterium]
MYLGFIGIGKISSSVIEGINRSKLKNNKIIISPRNKKISNNLKKKYKNIIIAKTNQEVVNKSNWVFLGVTPTVGERIIKDLKFKSKQTIISFISTITLSQLKKAIKVKAKIVRAIPLPPISLKKGPVPICPPNKKVKDFFNKVGTTVEIKNESLSINFWSTSGMMAPFYELLRVMTNWLIKKGVKRNNAQKYITSLFLALSEDAVVNSKKDLKYLVKESQTPKGLNEQGVKELTKAGFYKSLEKTLNNIHKRLNK